MRFARIDRYLLLLAVLFVIAVLKPGDFPGEEVLPTVYRKAVYQPLLAQAADAAHGDTIDIVKLRAELAVAKHRIAELERQIDADSQLAAYLKRTRFERRLRAVEGWIYAIESNPYRLGFRVDLNEKHNVRRGMPVVVGQALLGRVVAVERRGATVRRLDDRAFRIEVSIVTSDGAVPGVARGNGERGLDVKLVRGAGALRAGDLVYTAREDARIPGGLFVGEVSSVEDIDENAIPEVTVTPAVALGSWAQVTVLDTLRPR